MIYFLIGASSLFMMVINCVKKQFAKTPLGRFFLVVIFITLLLISGLRSIGFDYDNYFEAFKYLSTDKWLYFSELLNFEKGYSFLNYIIGDYNVLLFIISFIILSISFKLISTYSEIPFLSVFIFISMFYYIFVMGQFRQMLALSIVLLSLLYYPSVFKLILGLILASFIHTSSIICLLLIPLYFLKKTFSIKVYVTALVLALAISLISGNILLIIQPYLPDYINLKLELYLDYNEYTLGLNTANLIRIIVLFLSIGAYKRSSCISHLSVYSLFINMYFIGILIYTLLGMVPAFAGRGSMYFLFVEILLVPFILVYSKNYFLIPLFMLYVLQLVIRQFLFFSEWYDDYIPYNNILF